MVWYTTLDSYFRRRTFERIGWTKERKKVDIWAAKKWTFERGIFRTFERILEIGVDIWAEHILLIICDLIQLVPLPSAKLSHFKLILLPPAHQWGGGSRILSGIMFNLMKIMKWSICLASSSVYGFCSTFKIFWL